MGKEKNYSPLLAHLGLFGESQRANNQKAQVGPKTVDCVFLGYAKHSIGYRFLVVKSEVPDQKVGTIIESRDATLFEDLFPMRDMQSNPRLKSDETPPYEKGKKKRIPLS